MKNRGKRVTSTYRNRRLAERRGLDRRERKLAKKRKQDLLKETTVTYNGPTPETSTIRYVDGPGPIPPWPGFPE